MKARTFVLTLLLITSNIGVSQSIKRQSINSLSGSGYNNNTSIHQSVGQSFSTTNYYNNSFGIRSGFQQPELFFIDKSNTDLFQLDVFPNPATYSLSISNDEIIPNAQLLIFDMNGKEMANSSFPEFKSHSIDCSLWTNGTYSIIIRGDKNDLYTSKLIIYK